jgi:hypothetical protein
MLKSKKIGLAAVETIIVLSISGLLFAVVIGTLAFRKKVAVDDSAKQVMSQIARVRNQAQQGYTATQPASGNELFGKAIVIQNNTDTIVVKSLQQNISTKVIAAYGTDETITLPSQLKWYISTSSLGTGGCSGYYNSCNLTDDTYLSNPEILIFRNNTGQSYMLTSSQFNDTTNNYTFLTDSNQPNVRFAFAVPASGANVDTQFSNATAKYYANFDLSIPNKQDLTVVK